VSGTIIHQLLLWPPSFSQCRAQVPLRYHPLHPRLTAVRLSLDHTAPHRVQLFIRRALVHPVEPLGVALHRPLSQRDRAACPGTAPAPLLRSFDEACAYRIPFDVATDREKILARFDWKRLALDSHDLLPPCADAGATVAYA